MDYKNINELTDKELLLFAAKAAGIEGDIKHTADGAFWLFTHDHSGPWNPLENNGDAFWLAVTLGFSLVQQHTFAGPEPVAAAAGFGSEDFKLTSTDYNGDKFAASRRAIVKAAAEMGRRK